MELLRLAKSDELPDLVFCDEKSFFNRQFVNKQNDRLPLAKKDLQLATTTSKPAMVKVLAAITADGRSLLFFATLPLRVLPADRVA